MSSELCVMEEDNKIQKPFLKWIGGKTQIINNIINKIPKTMNNYHEPFLGGGSVLLAILSLQKQKKITIKNKIYACDINDSLINVYRHIQTDKESLYKYIEFYVKEYNSIKDVEINRKPTSIREAKTSKESYYYWIRNRFNTMDKTSIERSALFMFINKTCFRGMYRESSKGYNVPFGHYKTTPTIIDKKELDCISDLIKNVVFLNCDFNESFKKIETGDFVYVDPPYVPEENKKSFVGYVSEGFNLENHKILFEEIKKLNKKKIKFILSNSNAKLVQDTFKEYKRDEITARRAINSKNPGSTSVELIIHN